MQRVKHEQTKAELQKATLRNQASQANLDKLQIELETAKRYLSLFFRDEPLFCWIFIVTWEYLIVF